MPLNHTVNTLANSQAGTISHVSSVGARWDFSWNRRIQILILAKFMKGFIPPTESAGPSPKLFGLEEFAD